MTHIHAPGSGACVPDVSGYGQIAVFPNTHRQAVEQLLERYYDIIKPQHYNGYNQNKFPLNSLPFFISLGFLLLPKSLSGRQVRLATVAAVTVSAVYNISFTRAKDASTSALVGILNAYLVMWAIAHIGVVDPKAEYARIKSVEPSTVEGKKDSKEKAVLETVTDTRSTLSDYQVVDSRNKELKDEAFSAIGYHEPALYEWQKFPSSFRQRFDWVMDLFTNLEGMGWSWAISSLPPPPERVQKALNHSRQELGLNTVKLEKRWSRQEKRVQTVTETALLKHTIRQFIFGCIALDFLKTVLSLDPYFFGQTDALPPPYLPAALRNAFIVKGVRLLIALGCVQLAIQTLLLIRTMYYLHYHTPKSMGTRGEAWMFPSPFGSFKSVREHGLLGFWSSYWHQSFRYVFTAPTNYLLKRFAIPSKSMQAQILRLYIAFFCSGILHAGISHTAIGTTYPIRGPMMFFLLQPLGIFVQIGVSQLLQRSPVDSYVPNWLRSLSNVVWCVSWGYLTGPLLIEDLARGGQFLFEPVPFSVLRGIGLGNPDDGFYCWHGQFFSWQWDGWKSGIVS
jgi:hypothetical protein